MKYVNMNVEFKDPIKELQNELQRNGARNIDIRRNYNGDVEIRYTLKVADPDKDIIKTLEQAGAQNVRSSSSYGGARYEFRLDDMIDEREFKRKMSDILRRAGYRTN